MILGRYESPCGCIVVAIDGDIVHGLWFEGQRHFGRTITADAVYGEHPLLDKVFAWLDGYFAGNFSEFAFPLAPYGSAKEQQVRSAMLSLAPGTTVSYTELAAIAGLPHAVRAVASMVAKNPFIIVVPCHRVVGKDGSLTGYAAGLERKRALLELERQSS